MVAEIYRAYVVMPCFPGNKNINITISPKHGTAWFIPFNGRRHKLRHDDALFRLRRDVLRRSSYPAAEPPPLVLVIGFRSHGKSAFINTACRVMAEEDGPIVLRSETAPAGSPTGPAVTMSEMVVHVTARGEGEAEEVVVADMVDTPGFSGDVNLREDVEAAVRKKRDAKVECVVVVMKCPGTNRVPKKATVRKLEEIATVVHENGLLLVVVLTHKGSMGNAKQADELRDEIAVTARTDSVYLIDNYTAGATVRNTFDTHFNVLAIIRQCMEFAVIHRARRRNQPQPQPQLKERQSFKELAP